MAKEPVYQSLLLAAARALGAKVDTAPAEWTGTVFNAEVLSTALIRESEQRHDRDLPRLIGAARLDDMPVLIGELGGPPERASVNDLTRRYRNQATIARSWLGPEAANLQLFLIGPPDGRSDFRWRQLAAAVEADDRVCRKLVWLFQDDPSIEVARGFLDRTFLARPWQADSQEIVELDSMSDIALPAGWEAVVDDQELDTDQLVRCLIEIEEGPSDE
jgi:hypothetical protein